MITMERFVSILRKTICGSAPFGQVRGQGRENLSTRPVYQPSCSLCLLHTNTTQLVFLYVEKSLSTSCANSSVFRILSQANSHSSPVGIVTLDSGVHVYA